MPLLFIIVLILSTSIDLSENTQCAPSPDLAGPCGCCSIIGGSCLDFGTIDAIFFTWHTCVPETLRATFSLKDCQPHLIPSQNSTRLCRTKYGTFRFFPQCVTKPVCSIPLPKRNGTRQCLAPKAVSGPCNQTLTRYTYDAQQRNCVPFTYSGCGGTMNRFYSKERCETFCMKSKSS